QRHQLLEPSGRPSERKEIVAFDKLRTEGLREQLRANADDFRCQPARSARPTRSPSRCAGRPAIVFAASVLTWRPPFLALSHGMKMTISMERSWVVPCSLPISPITFGQKVENDSGSSVFGLQRITRAVEARVEPLLTTLRISSLSFPLESNSS